MPKHKKILLWIPVVNFFYLFFAWFPVYREYELQENKARLRRFIVAVISLAVGLVLGFVMAMLQIFVLYDVGLVVAITANISIAYALLLAISSVVYIDEILLEKAKLKYLANLENNKSKDNFD